MRSIAFQDYAAYAQSDHSVQPDASNDLGVPDLHARLYYFRGEGGPLDQTLLYSLYLYRKAFSHFEMGYASALAWIMLIIVGVLTLLIFRSSTRWVHYESKGD